MNQQYFSEEDLDNAVLKASELQNYYNEKVVREILTEIGFEPEICDLAISNIKKQKIQSKNNEVKLRKRKIFQKVEYTFRRELSVLLFAVLIGAFHIVFIITERFLADPILLNSLIFKIHHTIAANGIVILNFIAKMYLLFLESYQILILILIPISLGLTMFNPRKRSFGTEFQMLLTLIVTIIAKTIVNISQTI